MIDFGCFFHKLFSGLDFFIYIDIVSQTKTFHWLIQVKSKDPEIKMPVPVLMTSLSLSHILAAVKYRFGCKDSQAADVVFAICIT